MKSVYVFIAVYLLKIVAADQCSCGVESAASRIVGGSKVYENRYPWMVVVLTVKKSGGVFSCGGSIINDKFILTAAHCFEDAVKVQVSVGSNRKPEFTQFIDIEKWTSHEKYIKTTKKNDLALIQLKTPLQFSNKVRPICLPEKNDVARGEFTIAGWGLSEVGISKDLLEANVKEYDFETCSENYAGTLSQKTQICAGSDKGNACKGDSGGPLMGRKNGKIVIAGIASFIRGGRNCGTNGDTIFTRVEPFLEWIRKNSAAVNFANKLCDDRIIKNN